MGVSGGMASGTHPVLRDISFKNELIYANRPGVLPPLAFQFLVHSDKIPDRRSARLWFDSVVEKRGIHTRRSHNRNRIHIRDLIHNYIL
jgi:hypothetical protein